MRNVTETTNVAACTHATPDPLVERGWLEVEHIRLPDRGLTNQLILRLQQKRFTHARAWELIKEKEKKEQVWANSMQEVTFPSTCFALSLFSRVDKSTCPSLTFSCDYLLSLQKIPLPTSSFFFLFFLYLSLFPHPLPCCLDSIILCCLAASPY